MQSGSLYFGEFIFGETETICTAASGEGALKVALEKT
jgi:hypothetical protein